MTTSGTSYSGCPLQASIINKLLAGDDRTFRIHAVMCRSQFETTDTLHLAATMLGMRYIFIEYCLKNRKIPRKNCANSTLEVTGLSMRNTKTVHWDVFISEKCIHALTLSIHESTHQQVCCLYNLVTSDNSSCRANSKFSLHHTMSLWVCYTL